MSVLLDLSFLIFRDRMFKSAFNSRIYLDGGTTGRG